MSNFKHLLNYEFEQSIRQAKEEITTLLGGERTPEQGTTLQTATCIAAASQRASEAAKGTEPLTRKERAQYNQQVKPEEEKSLFSFATSLPQNNFKF
ncbi:MAG: hypothetical protein ACR2KB_01350 [Chitinophagaceae bacterium]